MTTRTIYILNVIIIFLIKYSSFAFAGWTQMDSGTSCVLYDVWGSSANDVFAVGDYCTIIHFDGNSWSQIYSDYGTLYGIWGTAWNNVFAVGGWENNILHYDGSGWSEMYSDQRLLYDIWGSSADNVFAVGEYGTILHFDGLSWTELDTQLSQTLYTVWGSSANDVFVATYNCIYRYDGYYWSESSNTGIGSMGSIWGSSGNDIYASGAHGRCQHYDGGSWSTVDSGIDTNIRGLWGSSNRDIFFVGGSGYQNGYGEAIIIHYNSAVWTEYFREDAFPLNSVWAGSQTDVFTVGYGGIVLRQVPEIIMRFDLNRTYFSPGYRFTLNSTIANSVGPWDLTAQCYIALDAGIDEYWFWPSWSHWPSEFDSVPVYLVSGEQRDFEILNFIWPDTGTSVSNSLAFWGVILGSDQTTLSNIAHVGFGFGPGDTPIPTPTVTPIPSQMEITMRSDPSYCQICDDVYSIYYFCYGMQAQGECETYNICSISNIGGGVLNVQCDLDIGNLFRIIDPPGNDFQISSGESIELPIQFCAYWHGSVDETDHATITCGSQSIVICLEGQVFPFP